MSKLQVAILEDNKLLLKELKQNLEATGLVEVIAWAAHSEAFLEKIEQQKPEALILDIEINGDSMSGIDIANRLDLPVLFVSGKTKDHLLSIEEVNLNSRKIIEHISKPITEGKLNKILPKFIEQIHFKQRAQFVYLDFKESKRNKISISDIVFLETDKNHGAKSNNKRIHFINRPPETLIDFSYTEMEDKGLSKNQFITISKSHRVNAELIESYEDDHHIVVFASGQNNKKVEHRLKVSENYKRGVKNAMN